MDKLTDLKNGEIIGNASPAGEEKKKFCSVSQKIREKRSKNWREFLNHFEPKMAQKPATGGGWEE